MKLSELKPGQTLSVSEAHKLFEEIKLTHQIAQYKKNGLIHCSIKEVNFIIGEGEGGRKVWGALKDGKIIKFLIESDNPI
jgi:hypothetical protein